MKGYLFTLAHPMLHKIEHGVMFVENEKEATEKVLAWAVREFGYSASEFTIVKCEEEDFSDTPNGW